MDEHKTLKSYSYPLDCNIQDLIPHEPICTEALNYVTPLLPREVLNHSLRVYLYAKYLQLHSPAHSDPTSPTFPDLYRSSSWPSLQLLFIASLFHDFGVSSICAHQPYRFEVCGADAAASFLLSHPAHASSEDAHRVWTAIALHTSPHIAERIDPFSRVMRLGPLVDFVDERRREFGVEKMWVEQVEQKLPRLGIEKCLGDVVVAQALQEPRKAPKGSWPGDLIRANQEREQGRGEMWKDGVNPEF